MSSQLTVPRQLSSLLNRWEGGRTVAKHLPDPAGEPDLGATQIMDMIDAYLASERNPVAITRGLRHVYHHAELAWDASVAAAKESATFAEIQEATGDALGTLQGRIRAHRRRRRESA